jgi:hypothetical protein
VRAAGSSDASTPRSCPTSASPSTYERPRPHNGAGRLPDAIDQRVDVCTDGLYGGLIGLVMGFWGAVASFGSSRWR